MIIQTGPHGGIRLRPYSQTSEVFMDLASMTPEQIVAALKEHPDMIGVVAQLAGRIDISWFEWCFKIALVAVGILCFKELVFSIYRYCILRADKFICIGTVIKFNHGVYGKIQSYNFRTIAIITKEGIVRIPLEVWLSTYYTQITLYNVTVDELDDITDIKRINKKQDDKLDYLYNELCDLKGTQSNDPSKPIQSTPDEEHIETPPIAPTDQTK